MRERHYLKTAFVGGQLITGRHNPAIQDSLVMIDEGRIIYAGERNYDMAPSLEGFDVVDITGKTLMPGIIDSHLHFSGNLNDNDSDWVREPLLQNGFYGSGTHCRTEQPAAHTDRTGRSGPIHHLHTLYITKVY